MTNSKMMKTYIYEGLGFPIELNNIEMVLVNDEYIPKLNIRKIADDAIKDLILQKTKLTGNQVRFIRSYFSLSLREFGEIVNESHMAVKKWENFNNRSTKMDPNIEITIRVFIYKSLLIKNKNDKTKFYDQYQAITKIVSNQRILKNNHLKMSNFGVSK